jgi:hypothetical protein
MLNMRLKITVVGFVVITGDWRISISFAPPVNQLGKGPTRDINRAEQGVF